MLLRPCGRARPWDEIELPLYVTCSRLFDATAATSARPWVSNAINQVADLGGSRIGEALRLFFTARNAPTLSSASDRLPRRSLARPG